MPELVPVNAEAPCAPFLHEIKPMTDDQYAELLKKIGATKASLERDVKLLREWLGQQPHLPQLGGDRVGPLADALPRRQQELASARQGDPREVLHVARPVPGHVHAAAVARRRAAVPAHQIRRAAHSDAAGHEDGHDALLQGAGRGLLQDGLGRVLQADVPHGGAVPGLGASPRRRGDLRRPGTLQRDPEQLVRRQPQPVQAACRGDAGLRAAALQGRAPAQRARHHQDGHRHGPALPQGQAGRAYYCSRELREFREVRPQGVPAVRLRRSVRQDPRSDVRRLAPHHPQQHALVQRPAAATRCGREQARRRQDEAGRLWSRGLLPEAGRRLSRFSAAKSRVKRCIEIVVKWVTYPVSGLMSRAMRRSALARSQVPGSIICLLLRFPLTGFAAEEAS